MAQGKGQVEQTTRWHCSGDGGDAPLGARLFERGPVSWDVSGSRLRLTVYQKETLEPQNGLFSGWLSGGLGRGPGKTGAGTGLGIVRPSPCQGRTPQFLVQLQEPRLCHSLPSFPTLGSGDRPGCSLSGSGRRPSLGHLWASGTVRRQSSFSQSVRMGKEDMVSVVRWARGALQTLSSTLFSPSACPTPGSRS